MYIYYKMLFSCNLEWNSVSEIMFYNNLYF